MGTSKKDKSDRERDKEERTSSKKRRRDSGEDDKESSRSGKRRNRSRERDRSRERSRHKAGHSRSRSRSRERGGKERGKGRDRSRDRSRSRERDSSRKSSGKEREKESSRKRDGHRRRRHSSSSSVEGEKRENSDKKRERDKDRERDRPHGSGEKEEEVGGEEVTVVPSSSGDATSLSIEETNKLRAKLGLKPLDVGDSKASSSSKDSGKVDGETNGEGQTTDEASAAKKKEDVHVPAKNIGDIKSAEKLKEKMAVMREKRRVAKLLSGVKTLGSAGDGGEDSAASWVIKMKQREEEKKKAAKKAQMLAEMDEEFGVGELVRESIKEERNKAYTSSDLSGLKVEHSTDAFREGKDIVLTLKDKGVLDEDDDVLMNVNIVDDEKAVKNVELKKGKSDYNPYEEEEVDEFGNLKRVSILKKYDEEIEGAKKSSFALGTQGEVDTSEDRQREIVRQRLKEKEISLELAPAQVASEYYTAEEMVQFKRPKKKRKIRKKEKVKADDLLSLESSQESSSRGASKDHGSRRSRGGDRKERGKADDEDAVMEVDIDPNTASDLKDEDDPNMDLALTRTRRLLQRSKPGVQGTAKVLSMLQSVPKVKEEPGVELGAESGEPGGEAIVLDTIAEFCRQVGEREGESHGGLYNEDEEEGGGEGEGEMEEEEQERRDDVMEVDQLIQEELGGWMEVKPHTQKKVEPKEEDLYQEAEPMVRSGIAAALQLASKKGFISGEKPKREAGESMRTTTDAKRDLDYERQRKQERDRELSRYDRDHSFPEKKNYTPNVKLEYVDEKGRLLSTKEAFRFMSHKFHGRGSGKKKIEKRMKKITEQQLMNKSSSVDTPLNMLSVMQNKQKAAQTPYILLSGGSQSMLAPNLAKGK